MDALILHYLGKPSQIGARYTALASSPHDKNSPLSWLSPLVRRTLIIGSERWRWRRIMGTSIPNPTKMAPLQGHIGPCVAGGVTKKVRVMPLLTWTLALINKKSQKHYSCCLWMPACGGHPSAFNLETSFFRTRRAAQRWRLQSSLQFCRERERGKKDKLM